MSPSTISHRHGDPQRPPRRFFRRGPWEAAAIALIAAGVVMLMQPFSLDALQLFLRRRC